jgi:hypothetical protein
MIGSVSVRNRIALAGITTLLTLVPLAATGCGGGTGTVSGQVLFQGKPLPGGVVIFRSVDTSLNPVSATLDADGKYEATVPVGEVKVTVDNRSLKNPPTGPVGVTAGPEGNQRPRGLPKGVPVAPPGGMGGEGAKDKDVPTITPTKQVGTYVAIPERYFDPDASGLSLKVSRGSQTFNIELGK